jgi:7-cyano-7-deazaguanine tRNA-ribosyltransferase
MQKARAHPKLMEAARLFSDLPMLEAGTPAFKEKAIYFYEPLDQHRPEAKRYRKMVSQFSSQKRRLVLCPETDLHPFYSTRAFKETLKRHPDAQICSYNPFLGIIPAEISDVFPAAHNIITRSTYSSRQYPTFVQSLKEFVGNNSFDEVILVNADGFIEAAAIEAGVTVRIASEHDAV